MLMDDPGLRRALLIDGRLPGDARVLALFVLEHGDGWHEIPHARFRSILDGASDEKVRRLLRRVEDSGWVEVKRATGRRAPQYRFLTVGMGHHEAIRDVLEATVAGLLPHTDVGQSDRMPHTREGQSRRPLESVGERNGIPHKSVGQKIAPHGGGAYEGIAPHQRGAEGRMPHTEEGQKAPTTTPSTTTPSLSAQARELVESSDELDGTRDELIAYLELGRNSFPEAYVRSVIGALTGQREELWTDQRGNRLREGRVEIVAGALNELAQCAEVGEHFPKAPGDFANLARAIRYRVKSLAGVEHDAERRSKSSAHRNGNGRPSSSGHGSASAPVRRKRRIHVEG